MLQMQMHWVIEKIKGEVSLCPKAAATSLLLALATVAIAARLALRPIMPNQVAAPVLAVGWVNAGIPLQKFSMCHQIIIPGAKLAWCHTPGSASQIQRCVTGIGRAQSQL